MCFAQTRAQTRTRDADSAAGLGAEFELDSALDLETDAARHSYRQLHLHRRHPHEARQVEQDVHGPAEVHYAVRRGLLGRSIYRKTIEWLPTQRRPSQIQQRAEVHAIVDRGGVVVRQEIKMFTSANISKTRQPNGEYATAEGLDVIPSEPVLFKWVLRPPASPSATSPSASAPSALLGSPSGTPSGASRATARRSLSSVLPRSFRQYSDEDRTPHLVYRL